MAGHEPGAAGGGGIERLPSSASGSSIYRSSPRTASGENVGISRRRFLLTAGILIPLPSLASATPAQVAGLLHALTDGAAIPAGLVKLDLPVLVENGNAVAMTVSVDAPTRAIHIFAEANPLPRVATFRFGPRAGAPRVATRIRLATSQTVIAVAELADGTFRQDSVDLLVTLAACIE